MTRVEQEKRTAQQALGAYGERVAEAHLVAAGMRLLDRNWRCSEGELDLVLLEGGVLVVCEVKTRTGEGGAGPHEAVTPAKLDRLQRLAERWQVEHDVRAEEVRLDLVAVHHPRRGAARLEHVRGLL